MAGARGAGEGAVGDQEVARRRGDDRPPREGSPDAFGVYLHVPFCARRCDYCAFRTWVGKEHIMSAYVEACRIEIRRAEAAGMPLATSVFVGGGTPSMLPAEELASLVDAVPRRPGAEVTVEANPGSFDERDVRTWTSGGVNRVSLGVQSTDPTVLVGLGRIQDPDTVPLAVANLKAAGVPTFNLDLIYGGAGETAESWERTLSEVLALGPPHVSAYALTVEPGTPLARDPRRHPDDDVQAERYEVADRVLAAAGLRWYEVSNWARPGHECRHNRLYWSQGNYVGIGAAAHSHLSGRRWWNVPTPEAYIARIRAGRDPRQAGEVLGPAERRFERLSLELRTREGVSLAELGEVGTRLAELRGLVELEADRVVLTRRGRLLANEVTLRLAD